MGHHKSCSAVDSVNLNHVQNWLIVTITAPCSTCTQQVSSLLLRQLQWLSATPFNPSHTTLTKLALAAKQWPGAIFINHYTLFLFHHTAPIIIILTRRKRLKFEFLQFGQLSQSINSVHDLVFYDDSSIEISSLGFYNMAHLLNHLNRLNMGGFAEFWKSKGLYLWISRIRSWRI